MTRIENDTLGAQLIPAGALYGAHTARALRNFRLSGRACHPALISAMAQVKLACARCNTHFGYIDKARADAICCAAQKIAACEWHEEIRVDALQGGAGTSLNMNLNEVIANCAEGILGGKHGEYQFVHPLTHVNLHQSSNDVFPTALRIAALKMLHPLQAAIAALQQAMQEKETAFAHIVKIGRTELQDACPTRLGASFAAFAEALGRDRWRVSKCEERLRVINLGGTAIGTGMGAAQDYLFAVVDFLRTETSLPLARAENLIDATQNVDVFVEVSGILKAHAVNLLKISSDLRLLASGPRTGLGEIRLPAVQVGSSLMPGKENPVICEAVAQAAMRCIAHDSAITLAAQHGQLELNAFLPLIADSLLDSLHVLTQANDMFLSRCIVGIEAQAEQCQRHVDAALSTVTALVPLLGYDTAALIAKEAKEKGCSIAAVVSARGLLDEETLQAALSAEAMTHLGFVPGP